MLRLSAERGLGAHPYFVPVEHTVMARETLGTGPLLAPEQAVVFETDPSKAREKLGWVREVDFPSLVKMMVDNDLAIESAKIR